MSTPLEQLADGLATLAAETLTRLAAGRAEVESAAPEVNRRDGSLLAGLDGPVVTVVAGYAENPEGGNVVVMDLPAARTLIGSTDDGELSDGELADVRAAGATLLDDAAKAVSNALGTRIRFGGPVIRVFDSAGEASGTLPFCTYQAHAASALGGATVRVAALIPQAVAVRLSNELDGMADTNVEARPAFHGTQAAHPSLTGVRVRVSAELGRTTLPSQELVELPSGAVIELDRRVEEPVEIMVNGRPYAAGRLVVSDSGEWAVEIDRVRGRV